MTSNKNGGEGQAKGKRIKTVGPGNFRPPSGGKGKKPSMLAFGRDAPQSSAAAPVASIAKARGSGVVNTVVYVHGIGNKPRASVLKCQWDTALFGAQLGDRSRMAYWVNRSYYPTPLDVTCASGDIVRIEDDEASTRAILAVASAESKTDSEIVDREIAALAAGDHDRERVLRRLADVVAEDARIEQERAEAEASGRISVKGGVSAKVLPLPEFIRRRIVSRLTRAFLRDVNDFLFDEQRRKAMEQSFLERLESGGGPFVVIAHSQGSMIAYEALRQLDPERIQVPLLVTIGAPLGLQEVQDVLRDWAGGPMRTPECVGKWLNVADRLDPVAADPKLEDDVAGGRVKDHYGFGVNVDGPRHPHSATGYLESAAVRSAVREVTGNAFEQAIAPFALAKDMVSKIEDGDGFERHAALIQLGGTSRPDAAAPKMLKAVAKGVTDKIAELVDSSGDRFEDAEVETLRHFVSAKLTRGELEQLRSYFADLKIDGIWRNAVKKALIFESTHAVQARPGNIGYGADGRGVCWAVLDTGIQADHPHFKQHGNVLAQWDCTKPGAPRKLTLGAPGFKDLDGHGHGTHVAGIIAGAKEIAGVGYAGMAPQASLYGFKVLDDAGSGNDAWIIKALDVIAELNDEAGHLVVQGVNLSLGGSFDPSVFGCGHTPLCQELRRLWRQGVLVCLAAGNEGYAVLSTTSGEIQVNLDLSIGDPANLEETIAVGSVHKTNPHTYGVSFFSSRGPTADGRRKPDVVAPGERIVSARHDWKSALKDEDCYVEMSGTSMAAPHVSGVLAAFLSLRREFIGYPDRVKEMLLASCVDLRRDPNMQGAGLPNLIKMLALN